MMPTLFNEVAPVPPPAYHRAQARLGSALPIDALTLVNTLHLLMLCRLAVRLAHHRCPPPLPAGPGGALRTYREESLLLIALLRTLWRLSYQDMRDWLRDWPALALACGLPLGKDGRPRVPSPSQQCKRGKCAGAPLPEALFVLTVLTALRRRLIGARDLIIDSVPSSPGVAPIRMLPDAACPSSASSSALTRLSRSYPDLPWFWLTALFSPVSRPLSMMLPLPSHSWHGQCICIASARA